MITPTDFVATFDDEPAAVQFLAFWLSARGRSYTNTSELLQYRFAPCTPDDQRVSIVELRARLSYWRTMRGQNQ